MAKGGVSAYKGKAASRLKVAKSGPVATAYPASMSPFPRPGHTAFLTCWRRTGVGDESASTCLTAGA